MTERAWLPTDWMDEVVPRCAADPAEFVTLDPDYGLRLVPLEHHEDGDLNGLIRALKHGQLVSFMWTERRGDALVRLKRSDEGGLTWETDATFDPDTNNFALADSWDYITPSIGELIEAAEADGELSDRDEVWVYGYVWSDEIMFRVTVTEGGQVSVVEAAQATPAATPAAAAEAGQ